MRIAFQYIASGRGGGFENVAELLRALAIEYSSDTLDIVCTEQSMPAALMAGPSNLRVHILPIQLPYEIERLRFESYGFGQLATRWQSDVLWSLNIGPYFRTGIPQVLSLNNAFQVYPWRQCASNHPGSGPNLAALRWFFRRALAQSDALIVQTPLMQRLASTVRGVPNLVEVVRKSVEDTNNTLVCEIPGEIRKRLRFDRFRFLYVATAFPHKNHCILARVAESLANRDEPIQLVLTITADELKKIHGTQVQRLIESGHIVCTGWANKELVRTLYKECDACVMPSRLESLSSCYIEAMSWDKPQIVSDNPFAHDSCGNAAIYVSDSDVDAWTRAMIALRCDEKERERLVINGRKQIELFPKSWRDMAKQVHAILEKVVVSRKC